MLKGTKSWDVAANKGIPPLLDYIKISLKLILSHESESQVFNLQFLRLLRLEIGLLAEIKGLCLNLFKNQILVWCLGKGVAGSRKLKS